MTANFSTIITPKPASEKGAVSGFKVSCSCGLVFSNSIEVNAQMEAAEHLAWHEKQAQKG
jgi:hypothetical protein